MSAAKRDDWADEKTVMNTAPGAHFAAAESGTRSSLGSMYDDDEAGELDDTRIRDVPSAVLRAAADPDGTLEVVGAPITLRELPAEPMTALAATSVAPPPATQGGSLATAIAVGALVAVTFVALAIAAVRWLF